MSSKTRLTVRQHYRSLFTFLRRHAHLWWSIGVELGFLPNELSIIQSNQILLAQNPPVSYVSKMLELWLQWAPGDGRGSESFATLEDLREALLQVDGIAADALDDLDKVLDQPPEESIPPVVHSTPQPGTLPQPNTDAQVPPQSPLIGAAAKQPIGDKDNYRRCDIDDVQSVPDNQLREASLQKKLNELEHEYRMITFNFDKLIQSINVALDDLQSYAASLPLRVQECYEELKADTFQSKTENAKNTRQFVAILNKFSNFINPALLGDAIIMFGDKKTKLVMNAYNSKLQEFLVVAKLEHFVNVAWKVVTPEKYEEIELVLKSNWHEKTLKDISPPSRYWLFKKVFEGSLKVIFAIPNLTDLEDRVVREYLQKHVEEVRVNGECYLRVDMISSQTASEESKTVEETFTSPDEIVFGFSTFYHGKNVIVSKDGLEARMNDVWGGGGRVYVPTPLNDRVEFEVEVTDCDRTSETDVDLVDVDIGLKISSLLRITIGITQICPKGSYRHLDIPYAGSRTFFSYSVDKKVTNSLSGSRFIESSHGSVHLNYLESGDRIGVQITSEGDLSFSLNRIAQGVIAKNIYSLSCDNFLFVDIGVGTTAVRITRAAMSGYEHPAEGHKVQVNQLERTISPRTIQFKFHPVAARHGQNFTLLEDGLCARKINPEHNHTPLRVYGSMPINPRGTFEVEIVEFNSRMIFLEAITYMQVGVMKLPRGTELNILIQMQGNLENDCMWSGYEVYNRLSGYLTKRKYGSVSRNNQGDKLGMRLSSDGTLSFFFNGESQGVAVRSLRKDEYDYYPVVELHKNCYAVRITRAETRSEEVFSLQELCIEKISSCLDWSSDVNLLPLPQKLKNQIEDYIDYL